MSAFQRVDPERGPLGSFRRFHRAVGVELTMRCPLRCGHCGYDSGPERREQVDAALLAQRIRQAARAGRLELVIVSGGEPFAAPAALREVLEAARHEGVAVAVNTAAHWATHAPAAGRVLDRFPGIAQLHISADPWHSPFVPLARVRHAAAAAVERGLRVVLMVRVFPEQQSAFLDELAAALGPALCAAVELDLGPVSRVGRAEALAPAGGWPPPVPALPRGRCRWADAPVVDTDGAVLACCNHAVASHTPALRLGELAQHALAEVAARADADPILQALRVHGPAWLAERAAALGCDGTLRGAWPPGDVCGLCEDVLADEARVDALRRALSTPEARAELALARLLQLGEVDPTLANAEAQR